MSYDPNQSHHSDATPPPEENTIQSDHSAAAPSPEENTTQSDHSDATPSPEENTTQSDHSDATPSPNENPGISYPPPPSENFNANYPPPPNPGYGYPPPPPHPGYGYPPPGYGYPSYPGAAFTGPPAQPLPLGEAIKQLPAQLLRVLTKPGAATFAQEKSKAAWNIIWVMIAFVAVLNAIFVVILYGAVLPGFYSMMQTSNNQFATLNQNISLPAGIGSLVLAPIFIFISVGLYYLIAKAFKGQGTFIEQLYCYMLLYVPQAIATVILGWIPVVGSLIIFAISVYIVVLQVYMTMAVHRMSGGRATLAVLILPIIAIVLICGIIGIFFAIAVSMAQNLQH